MLLPSDEGTSTDVVGSTRLAPATQPHVILAFECARPLAGSARHSLANIDEVVLGRGATRAAARRVEGGVRTLLLNVPDRRMSSRHARIVRDGDGFVVADEGSSNGLRLNGERITRAPLFDGDLIEAGHTFFRFRAAIATAVTAPADVDSASMRDLPPGFATLVPSMADGLDALERVSKSAVSVLLLGETGTGKEVLARSLHALSGRRGAFVAINCGALPEGVLEAQLFGHARGAFSGAVRDEPGFVRSADGGTLFLDEIGDMPLTSQTALLRVLQEREVIPVGTTRPVRVDLRVVAATHMPIDTLSARGEFRSDLFARIAGFSHALPPLRDRIDDFGILVADLLPRVAPTAAASLTFAPDAARALLAHRWPLNVRELAQCLEVSTVLARSGVLDAALLPRSITHAANASGTPAGTTGTLDARAAASGTEPPAAAREVLSKEEEALRALLLEKFAEHDGNVTDVGRAMGKARTQIQRWMKRFGIDRQTFRR